MVAHELRIIVEKVSVSSQEVVKRDTLKIYNIKGPESILELGLRHAEQISLLEKVQNALLAEQSLLIEQAKKVCPVCGDKLKKNGYRHSKFHAVFSDHELRVQKHICKRPECNWSSSPTVTSLFGTDMHPDLAKLQCEQGALYSFREAQSNLGKLNCQSRSINNSTQIKRVTAKVGEILSQKNYVEPYIKDCSLPTQELIVQVDGGHIPIQDKEKRSFEALSAVIYQPGKIRDIDKNHRQIRDKTCVASAKNDELKTIKAYVTNGAKKQGLTQNTKVIGLADGAKNCWSILETIEGHCQSLEKVLDWFHIGQKFENIKKGLRESSGKSLEKSLESAKWEVWNGHGTKALRKLLILKKDLTDEKKRSQLQGLYDYLYRNQDYLVNYEARKQAQQIYTSQVAESHIESLINARHKRSGKMQWSREGAHQVLQIRAMMASRDWQRGWQKTILSALGAVA